MALGDVLYGPAGFKLQVAAFVVKVLMWIGNEEQQGWNWEEEMSWAFSFGKVSIFRYK